MKLDYTRFDRMHMFMNDGDFYDKLRLQAQYALDETNRRIEKAKKKQEEIDNLTYEKNLIMDDALDLIREDVAQSYYNIFRYFNVGELLWEAWKYSSFKGKGRLQEIEESHKEEPEHCKPLEDFENAYNFVLRTIKDRLIPEEYAKDSELVEIVDWCYSTAYEFTFRYKNVEYTISVPVFERANNDNYVSMLCGYALRFRESEYCIGLAFCSLDPNDFKIKLKEWLDQQLEEARD